MLYEFATLSCSLLAIGKAAEGVDAWVHTSGTKGQLLGCWRTEMGTADMARLYNVSQPTVSRIIAQYRADVFFAHGIS